MIDVTVGAVASLITGLGLADLANRVDVIVGTLRASFAKEKSESGEGILRLTKDHTESLAEALRIGADLKAEDADKIVRQLLISIENDPERRGHVRDVGVIELG